MRIRRPALVFCLLGLVCLTAFERSSSSPTQRTEPIGTGAAIGHASGPIDDLTKLRQLRESHRLTEAETEGKRMLAAAVRSHGADSPQAIEISELLTHILMDISKRRLPEAIRYAENALASAERIYPPGDLRLTRPIESLADAVDFLGSFEEGNLLYERSLAIKQAVLGPDDESVAETLDVLASSYGQLGDNASKRLLLERALVIYEQHRTEGHALAGLLGALAFACASEGDLEAALSFAERGVRLMTEAAPDPLQTTRLARALNTKGQMLRELGRYAEAYDALDRAQRYLTEALGPQDGNVGWMMSEKSLVLSAQGRHAEARGMAQAGLDLQEKAFGLEDRTRVMYLRNLATVLSNAGDDAGAEPLLSRALILRERAYGSGHPGLRELLDMLARVRYRLREDGGALDDALRSESIGREDFQDRVRILSERQMYQFETSRVSSLQVALSVLDRRAGAPSPVQAERVLDELVRSRALVLDELTSRQSAAMREEGPEVAALLQEVRVAKSRLAALVLQGTDSADGVGIEAMAAARSRKERAEQKLARHSAEQRRRLARGEVGLAAVRAALPPESALVSFVEYERVAGAGGGVPGGTATSTAGRHYAAFVLKGASERALFVSLGPADEIDALVARWQENAGENPQLREESLDSSETRYRRAGTELRKRIWDPLTQALAGLRIVFVVPDGALHLVNLSTLPAAGDRYLVETGPLVHYLSAERDLALQTRKQYARAGALILGGPDPDAEPSGSPTGTELAEATVSGSQSARRSQPAGCQDFRSMRFEPLSGAMAEASEVGALWKGTRGVVELTGPAATESAFKMLAPGRRLLHLATHGFFLQDQCASAVHGSGAIPAPARWPGQAAQPVVGDNPLLLSGLILAGANRRAKPTAAAGGEDGILTAEEIGSLDLSGVEWAVLSACETGIGKVRAGEGILGLRRAFEVAGAGTLITSLWRVEDEATRVWMRNLYRARLSGRSTVEAVSDASLSMLHESRSKRRTTHPFYWGGFVAAGDWR